MIQGRKKKKNTISRFISSEVQRNSPNDMVAVVSEQGLTPTHSNSRGPTPESSPDLFHYHPTTSNACERCNELKEDISKLHYLQSDSKENLKVIKEKNSRLNMEKEELMKRCNELKEENSKLHYLQSDSEENLKDVKELKEKISRLKKENKELMKNKSTSYYNPKDIMCASGDAGLLGSGSYGSVRLAFEKAYGAFAVKCFQATGSPSEVNSKHQTIQNECRMLQISSHVNVVRVIGYTTWSRSAAVIMEFMPGGDLKALLLHKKIEVPFIPPIVQLKFVSDISSGLAFMHNISFTQRITHGDLKVDNVLMSQDLTCKISDLGGAHFATCTEESSVATTSHKNTHTNTFLAPEGLKNPRGKDRKSMDVYSFSMMIYMILLRKYPYDSNYVDVYLEGIKKGDRPEVSLQDLKKSLLSSDSESIELLHTVMKSCWQHEPKERPQIIDVRGDLTKKLSTIESWKIQKPIADICKGLDMKTPCQNMYDCKPMDQFSPPTFEWASES